MAAKMTYEQAMKRLEEIVEKLDDGSLPLEDSIKLFEESTKLAAFCNDTLEKAKLKVTELAE
ncbi:MAG: exodeoxyribonuclease VII small subunit [Clostridia bacterium]|nr:exodeoxyribonuclease VII small subunit [Clostridia bacterium]